MEEAIFCVLVIIIVLVALGMLIGAFGSTRFSEIIGDIAGVAGICLIIVMSLLILFAVVYRLVVM